MILRGNLSNLYTCLFGSINIERTIIRKSIVFLYYKQFDIIPYFTWPDIVVSFDVEFIGYGTERITITPPSGGQRAVAVTARGREGVDTIRVTVKIDGRADTVIEYEMKQNLRSARRVAWLNRPLAPELYTFPLR